MLESIEGNSDRDKKRNDRYKERYGRVDKETVVKNISELYYTESKFDNVYYGGLSHDSLIFFAYHAFEKFPILSDRLKAKYQVVYLDEYQDTSIDVLNLLYNCLKSSKVKLYLFGDKMQQIYDTYSGKFDERLREFNLIDTNLINYRSSPKIVDLLNKIYNDSTFKQEVYSENINKKSYASPHVIFCKNIDNEVEVEGKKYSRALRLYLFNKERFREMKCESLYLAFESLDQYGYNKKTTASDVLTQRWEEQSDPLLIIFNLFYQIDRYYKEKNIGSVIQLCKKYSNFFNTRLAVIDNHSDRVNFVQKLKDINNLYAEKNISLSDFMQKVLDLGLLRKNVFEELKETHNAALEVKLSEFKHLAYYLAKETISTQHAVKGESHEEVFFIHNDSFRIPNVRMSDFFKLWSRVDMKLDNLRKIVDDFTELQTKVEELLGHSLSKSNASEFDNNKKEILKLVRTFEDLHNENHIYRMAIDLKLIEPMSGENITSLRRFLKSYNFKGIENAYKLFYVGCSRARSNLTVFIDKEKIQEVEQELIEKFKNIGFEVEIR
jgi:DNA helicase-2/ATP-dependent DNA helicase PcrA